MDIVSILKQVDLFRGLTSEQLAQIEAISQQMTVDESEFICRQGDVADQIYIVSHGQVEVRVRHTDGSDEPVVFLGRGQVVGEMTLVDAGRRSASVIAAEEQTQVVSIPNSALAALCESNTAIGYLIMRNIAQDLSFKLRHRDMDTLARDNGSER